MGVLKVLRGIFAHVTEKVYSCRRKLIAMEDNFGIQLFEGKKVRFVWNEEQEKYYISVIDVVQILTDSADIKQYVKRMRARDPKLNVKWGTICPPVEMIQKLKVSQYY